jgi:hypothetical protein
MVTLERLRSNKPAREMLRAFDFQVQDEASDPVWFDTVPLEPFEVIAQKGSGCVYALIGPQRHVLFATSEGQAGVIAASLTECLELIVAYPYWEEVLGSSRGDLAALRRLLGDDVREFEEGALEDDPEIEDYRPLLHREFGLSEPTDPARSLLHAISVLGAGVIVRAPDGHPAGPFFGTFAWTPKDPS